MMRDNYMRLADGLLLVYSVMDPRSFEEATKIYNFSCQVKGVDTVPAVRVHSHRAKSNAKEIFSLIFFALNVNSKLDLLRTHLEARSFLLSLSFSVNES